MAAMKTKSIFCVAVLMTALGSGCTSLTFHHDWNQALAAESKPDGLEGAWAGSWRSNVNGHNGSLKCLMTRVDDQTYRARYFARYFGELFAFEYTVDLKPKERDGAFFLEGQADLGLMGGLYSHKGHIKGDRYDSTYKSQHDEGVYKLRRQ